ncbi:MAG: Diaminopimelate epimerase [Proteiniphilum sp. 51_7]|jgi:diaminopimelate epimerase|nr:MAG: Diaminopimelate epimerase [Proteiniphilum sp. 51_7]
MKFEKMHAAGNDYIYVNLFEEKVENPEELSRRLSDRHFGVGGDGLVLIGPAEQGDFSMRMFNADGSEGLMCGNAARCVGRYLYERGLTNKKEIALQTLSGIKQLWLTIDPASNRVTQIRVDMGPAICNGSQLQPPQSLLPEMVEHPLEAEGVTWPVTFVSMGNPHAVIFTEGIDALDLQLIGSKIEHHPLFPQRTNVEFVEVIARDELRMRVWERGSGETLACGSGACAVLAAAVLTGRADPRALVHLRGGDLQVEWERDQNRVFLTGDAQFVFKGELL